jgi:hypothetical protein
MLIKIDPKEIVSQMTMQELMDLQIKMDARWLELRKMFSQPYNHLPKEHKMDYVRRIHAEYGISLKDALHMAKAIYG